MGVAVEITPGQPQMWRIRLAHIEDLKASSVIPFVRHNVAPMSAVYTDGWDAYNRLPQHLYPHVSMTLKNSPWYATDIMPAVHRVASLLKRWLLGTHNGGIRNKLQGHLDEFVF